MSVTNDERRASQWQDLTNAVRSVDNAGSPTYRDRGAAVTSVYSRFQTLLLLDERSPTQFPFPGT